MRLALVNQFSAGIPGMQVRAAEATLGEMLHVAARRYGDKPLLVCVDRTLSARELDALASRLASQFAALGIEAGDRVTLWMENGWRWMVAYYAVLRLGGVVVPCNILLTADEVTFIAEDSGSKALIAAHDRIGSVGARSGLLRIVDQPAGNGQADIESLIACANAADRLPASPPGIDRASLATIGYTSGTTGRPKGAVLTHASIVINTAMTALMHGRGESDVVVSALPCTHVYGNVVMNSAVSCGMTLVLLPRFEEATTLAAIVEHRATMFEGVPTMFMKLLNFPELERYDLSSLRICTVGGQTMPVARMEETERRFGCPLLELWGMTELGGLGTTHPHNGPRRLGSIGVALPLSQTRVAVSDDPQREVPPGEVGELLIRGPTVMNGYLNNSDATAATLEPGGWLHTGDLVRQDADGYLFVVDRAKEVIISGGYNIYPAEVERVIAQHPAVAMVAVAAMRDEARGQAPKAFVVARVGDKCTAAEIIEHCRPQLASYKIPRAVEFVDDLPKTSTGKILRRVLAESSL